jgi:hypothetical protein
MDIYNNNHKIILWGGETYAVLQFSQLRKRAEQGRIEGGIKHNSTLDFSHYIQDVRLVKVPLTTIQDVVADGLVRRDQSCLPGL